MNKPIDLAEECREELREMMAEAKRTASEEAWAELCRTAKRELQEMVFTFGWRKVDAWLQDCENGED